MADKTITLTTQNTTGEYDGRYLKLVCEQTSKSSANNTSTIKWTLSAVGGSVDNYSTGPTKVEIIAWPSGSIFITGLLLQ